MSDKPWPKFDQVCMFCGTPYRETSDGVENFESKYHYLVKAYAEISALLAKERLKYEAEIAELKKHIGPYEDPETKIYTETGI